MPISDHAINLLAAKNLSQEDYTWILEELESLDIQFKNPNWPEYMADAYHTQAQVGFLAGIMDLERDERLEVLEILTGIDLHWDGEWFPGSVAIEDLPEDKRYLYPGKSSKDNRLTRWMMSVLIDYYDAGDGIELNDRLQYRSKAAIVSERRAARRAAKEAAALAKAAKKQQRLLSKQSQPSS